MPPRLARLLAVVVAVALVGGALAVRGVLAGDDDAVTADGGGGNGDPDGGALVLLCDADLGEAACAAAEGLPEVAEVRTVSAADVLAGFADGTDAVAAADLWLTLDPMPAVLGYAVDGPGGFEPAGPTPLASAVVDLLVPLESALACAEPADWTCLVAPVRPPVAVPDPASSAGTLVAAGATDALTAAAGGDLDTDGLTAAAGDTALDQVRRLFAESPVSDLEAQAGLLYQPGRASAVVTTDGLAARSRSTAQGAERRLKAVPIAPEVTIGVVLVGLGSADPDRVATLAGSDAGQTVRAALAEGGWAGEPTRSAGLPEPDLVYGVREELV